MSSSLLPEFEEHAPYPFGVLPDGVHATDEPTFRRRFVDAFPDSRTRAAVCDGFFRLRQEAAAHGISATQWINGSFVEGKVDPEDIDLVTFIDFNLFCRLERAAQEFAVACLHGREETKSSYCCHTFMVLFSSPEHPFFRTFEDQRLYWRKWFGHTRTEPIRPGPSFPSIAKGIIEIVLGDPKLAPEISREETTQ